LLIFPKINSAPCIRTINLATVIKNFIFFVFRQLQSR
jgi:hypothetical protein